jgi:hypothetical protein
MVLYSSSESSHIGNLFTLSLNSPLKAFLYMTGKSQITKEEFDNVESLFEHLELTARSQLGQYSEHLGNFLKWLIN